MTLQSIKALANDYSTLVEMDMQQPAGVLSPFRIRSVDGLGPVAATVTATSYLSTDGAAYQGSRVNTRNIVLTLGLEVDYTSNQTASALRKILYHAFAPKRSAIFRITDSELGLLDIKGYVESITPTIFGADPAFQVSIICPLPYFYVPIASLVNLATGSVGTPFTYNGDADTDYQGQVLVTNTASQFVFSVHGSTGQADVLTFNPPLGLTTFNAGDNLQFSTTPGSKFAQIIRGSTYYNLLPTLVGSLSLTIRENTNSLTWADATQGANATSIMQISYSEKHVGI